MVKANSQSYKQLDYMGIVLIKSKLLINYPNKYKICFLNATRDCVFQIFMFSLLHSNSRRIERILKEFVFHLKRRMFFSNSFQLTSTCSKSTLQTLEKGVKYDWCHSDVSIVNFEHIPRLFLVFLLLFWASKC